MRYVLFGFVVALGAGLTIPAAVRADEQGELVATSDLPRDAADTVGQMSRNVDWLFAFRFNNDGKPYYRVVGKDAQMHTIFAEVTPEGKPLMLLKSIAYQDVPESARRALKDVAPGFEPHESDLSVQAVGFNDQEVIVYQLKGSTPGNSDATYIVKADGSEVVNASDSAGPTL